MRLAHVRLLGAALAGMFLIAAGCTSDEADARAPGGGAPAGKKEARTVVVAPSDVAVAQTGSISDGVPITGTLQPIETVDVRARLAGNLTGVYVREGQGVSRDQLLAQFEGLAEQSSAASAEATRVSARADLSQAQWNLKQTTDLYHAGAVSEADYRTAQQQVDAATARLAAAEAALRAASLTARDTRVTAPIAGIVDKRMVDVGERLAAGDPMFTIVRNSTLELGATVPERRASSVKVGQRATFMVGGQNRAGRVARVSPTIDPSSRSVTVYVDVDNADGSLKGNSLATGMLIAKTVNGTLVVPTRALHQSSDSGSTYVYRVNTGTVDQVTVGVGIVDNSTGQAQITSGLSAGDKVLVGNLGTLSAGAKIQVVGGDTGPARP